MVTRMMKQVPAFTESSYIRLESTTGTQERVSYSETVGYTSLNRKDKMELVAKDHAQRGPHKSLQVRERYVIGTLALPWLKHMAA